MGEFKKINIQFENETLNELVINLNCVFNNNQKNFIDICVGIHKIWEYCRGNYWKAKDNEYYNSYKLLAKFGFDKKAVSRYKACYDKFIDVKSDGLFRLYAVIEEFSPSKLFELLSLSKDTIISLVTQSLITPDMTVKEIRDFIKNLKNQDKEKKELIEEKLNDNSEAIEESAFYNPNKHYDMEFFESCTKEQLLTIIWTLQFEYEKLKKKK